MEEVYCICQQPAGGRDMIGCDSCEEWYHLDCVGLDATACAQIESYQCSACINRNPELHIVYYSEEKRREMTAEAATAAAKEAAIAAVESLRSAALYATPQPTPVPAPLGLPESTPSAPVPAEPVSKNQRGCANKGCANKIVLASDKRYHSKYCSFACGMAVSRATLAALDAQAVAASASRMDLSEVSQADKDDAAEAQRISVQERRVESMIAQLVEAERAFEDHVQAVVQGTLPAMETTANDTSTEQQQPQQFVDCVCCLSTVTLKALPRHAASCFTKLHDRRDSYISPVPAEGAAAEFLCNTFDKKQRGYCIKLRVMCPVHKNHPRPLLSQRADKLAPCACPLATHPSRVHLTNTNPNSNPIDTPNPNAFCREPNATCPFHVQWERNGRAQFARERTRLERILDSLSVDRQRLQMRTLKRSAQPKHFAHSLTVTH